MSQQGSSHRSITFGFIGAISLTLAGSGCGASTRGDEKPMSQNTAKATEGDNVVIAWNKIALDAAIAHDNFDGFENHRGIAMMHLAIHDALNAIEPKYTAYAFSGPQPADPIAAVAQAGRDVLVSVYAKQQAAIDGQLATWLAKVPDGEDKTRGVQLGKEAAAAIITARQGDGMDTPPAGGYTPGKKPGNYQFVPPFDFVYKPKFGASKPFGLKSPDQFTPGPPPALTSAAYATAYNEVKAHGGKTSTARTQDQANLSNWWYEGGGKTWNRVASTLARERKLDLHDSARLFALINIAVVDALVAVWEAKQHYDFWRPYTAIRSAASDGNPNTEPDPKWESYLVTLPVQDYPSALAAEAGAATGCLRAFFGTDDVPFSSESSSGLEGAKVRSFKTLTEAANEGATSRIMNGLHFRFSTDAGLALGAKIAEEHARNHLRPIGPGAGKD